MICPRRSPRWYRLILGHVPRFQGGDEPFQGDGGGLHACGGQGQQNHLPCRMSGGVLSSFRQHCVPRETLP